MAKILLVEDDSATSITVQELLRMEGYTCDAAFDGDSALDYLAAFSYDLLILDRQLPGPNGIEICKHYRKKSKGPVLMLTGLGSVTDKVEGLDAGADDYLAKPFDSRELSARIRSLLRRATDSPSDVIEVGNISIDTRSHIVTRDGAKISLTPKEYDVLEFFVKHPNQVISTEALIKRVWQSDADTSQHAVYICINRLRKNLNPQDKEAVIKTVHGVGYRLDK